MHSPLIQEKLKFAFNLKKISVKVMKVQDFTEAIPIFILVEFTCIKTPRHCNFSIKKSELGTVAVVPMKSCIFLLHDWLAISNPHPLSTSTIYSRLLLRFPSTATYGKQITEQRGNFNFQDVLANKWQSQWEWQE